MQTLDLQNLSDKDRARVEMGRKRDAERMQQGSHLSDDENDGPMPPPSRTVNYDLQADLHHPQNTGYSHQPNPSVGQNDTRPHGKPAQHVINKLYERMRSDGERTMARLAIPGTTAPVNSSPASATTVPTTFSNTSANIGNERPSLNRLPWDFPKEYVQFLKPEYAEQWHARQQSSSNDFVPNTSQNKSAVNHTRQDYNNNIPQHNGIINISPSFPPPMDTPSSFVAETPPPVPYQKIHDNIPQMLTSSPATLSDRGLSPNVHLFASPIGPSQSTHNSEYMAQQAQAPFARISAQNGCMNQHPAHNSSIGVTAHQAQQLFMQFWNQNASNNQHVNNSIPVVMAAQSLHHTPQNSHPGRQQPTQQSIQTTPYSPWAMGPQGPWNTGVNIGPGVQHPYQHVSGSMGTHASADHQGQNVHVAHDASYPNNTPTPANGVKRRPQISKETAKTEKPGDGDIKRRRITEMRELGDGMPAFDWNKKGHFKKEKRS